jgi:hypothetical protein
VGGQRPLGGQPQRPNRGPVLDPKSRTDSLPHQVATVIGNLGDLPEVQVHIASVDANTLEMLPAAGGLLAKLTDDRDR